MADPDDHHLFASLGCATENLVLAARAHGLEARVELDAQEDGIRIHLEPATVSASPMFQAVPERRCTRAEYDGRPVPTDSLAQLEAEAGDDHVTARIFTDQRDLETILELVVAGNTVQWQDDAFLEELAHWLRFNESAVVEHRDGLYSAASGNPTMPDWLGRIVVRRFVKAGSENDKCRDQIRSSAGLVAFVSERNDKEHWVHAGRCFQRFALRATVLGLRHAFVNQAVDVPEVRAEFTRFLGAGDRRPSLLVRFGHGPEMPRSLRRPVDEVLA